MKIIPVISGYITDSMEIAFAAGVDRAKIFSGRYHKEALEVEGTTVIIDVRDYVAYVIIVDQLTPRFLSNPRLFGINDGYVQSEEALVGTGEGTLEFPLSATTSQALFIEEDELTISRDKTVYGNIDWVGINTADEGESNNAPVLTWKGPIGRSIPFDFTKPIEGFTTIDIKFSETGTEYYTCFGPEVYQDGAILATIPTRGDIPPKVVGAAITKNGDDELLVCVVNNHGTVPLGFTDEVWVQYGGEDDEATGLKDGWRVIHIQAAGRPSNCWFFNQSGTKCTRGNAELTIDVVARTVTQTLHDTGSGTYTLTHASESHTNDFVVPPLLNTGGYAGEKEVGSSTTITIQHRGSYHIYSDYKGDERVTAPVTVSDHITRVFARDDSSKYTDISLWYQGTKPALVIHGPDVYTDMPGAYYIDGYPGMGSATWTYPELTACGMGTVSVTDSCGASASKQVRMPDGHWGDLIPSDNVCGTGSAAYLTASASRTVIMVSFDGCGYSPTNGTRDCFPLPENYDYTGAVDGGGILVTSNGESALIPFGGTHTFSDYYVAASGVVWRTAWIKGCVAGTQTWEC